MPSALSMDIDRRTVSFVFITLLVLLLELGEKCPDFISISHDMHISVCWVDTIFSVNARTDKTTLVSWSKIL
jgi:hypothetical protein